MENQSDEKRKYAKKITIIKLSVKANEFFEENNIIKKSSLIRNAIDEKIEEIKKGEFKIIGVEKENEIDTERGATSLFLYQDQEEFFEKNDIFTKTKFIRLSVDETIKRIKENQK